MTCCTNMSLGLQSGWVSVSLSSSSLSRSREVPNESVSPTPDDVAPGSLVKLDRGEDEFLLTWLYFLQASLLGFGIFKVLPRIPWFSKRPLSIHENVNPVLRIYGAKLMRLSIRQIVLQTTAVATGTLPLAAGFVGGELRSRTCILATFLTDSNRQSFPLWRN